MREFVNKKWNEEDSYVRAQYKSKAKEQSGQASGKHDDNATYDGDGDSDEAHGALGRPLPLASSTGDFPINPRDVEIYQDQHSFALVVKDFEARRGIRQLPHLRETKPALIVKLPQYGMFQASQISIFMPSRTC